MSKVRVEVIADRDDTQEVNVSKVIAATNSAKITQQHSVDVDISAAGVKSLTFIHTLPSTPQKTDVVLQMSTITDVDDWDLGLLVVTSTTASNVYAKLKVKTPSATASSVVRVTATMSVPVV